MKNNIDGYDLLFLVGLGLLSAGSFLIYEPAALIVPGFFFIIVGMRGSQ